MARNYRHIQMYGKEIFELKEKGLTHKEIAEKLGLTKEQVKEFIKREHRKERKATAGIALKKKGRPPKDDKFSNTDLRVMNKYSLLSVVLRRRYCNYSQALHRYENLLNRDFHADRPNQKWVTDISYDDAKRLIDDYIYFYNHQRIQLKTKLTPLELRSQFVP